MQKRTSRSFHNQKPKISMKKKRLLDDNSFGPEISSNVIPGQIRKTTDPDQIHIDHGEDYRPPTRDIRAVSFFVWIHKMINARKLTENTSLRRKLLDGRRLASYFDGLQEDEVYEKFLQLHHFANDLSDSSVDEERFKALKNFACSAFKDLSQTRHPDAMHVFRKIQSKTFCEENLFVWLEEASSKTHRKGAATGTIHISDLSKFTDMLNCESDPPETPARSPYEVWLLIAPEH